MIKQEVHGSEFRLEIREQKAEYSEVKRICLILSCWLLLALMIVLAALIWSINELLSCLILFPVFFLALCLLKPSSDACLAGATSYTLRLDPELLTFVLENSCGQTYYKTVFWRSIRLAELDANGGAELLILHGPEQRLEIPLWIFKRQRKRLVSILQKQHIPIFFVR